MMMANKDDLAILIPYKRHVICMKRALISVTLISVYVGDVASYNTAVGEAAVWGPENLSVPTFLQAKKFIDTAFEKYDVWR